MRRDRLARVRWCPELALFDSEEERKAVIKRFKGQGMRGGRYWFSLLTILVCSGVVMVVVSLVARRLVPAIPQFIEDILGGAVVVGSIVLGFRFFWNKPCRRFLREQLVAKGVPICIACGYDLRGQVDPRCPECGTAFDPKLIKPTEDPAAGPSDSHDATN